MLVHTTKNYIFSQRFIFVTFWHQQFEDSYDDDSDEEVEEVENDVEDEDYVPTDEDWADHLEEGGSSELLICNTWVNRFVFNVVFCHF